MTSAMDLKTLRAFKQAEYEEAADGYRAVGEMAMTAKDTIDTKISVGVRRDLEGKAAEAALGELKALSKNFHYAQTECGLVSTALNGFAFDIGAAKRKLDAAIADAQAAGCTVNPNGSVSFPPGAKPGAEKVADGGTVTGSGGGGSPTSDAVERQAVNIHPNPHYGKALGFADRVAEALKEATDADAKWAPRLRRLKADDDLVVSHSDWVDTAKDTADVRDGAKTYLDHIKAPPKNGDAAANAAWWKGLSEDEQAAYLSLNAAQVGALDGLPSTVRDEANRTVLAEKKAEYQLRLDAIPPQPQKYVPSGKEYPKVVLNPAWSEWNDKYAKDREHLDKALKGMNAIEARFDATGKDDLPPAYLLGFDTAGGGRAIVANGNPDTADHTAVFVPGTYTDITKTESYIGHMANLWQASQVGAGGESVSTITWIGYDAPQSIVPEAMYDKFADEAAPDLNRFMAGLETVQGGPEASHTTVIGHSYGSTVVGAASEEGDLAGDDIIAVGSPGMRVGYADELDAPKGHVWSETAGFTKDQVPAGGKIAGHGGDSDLTPWVSWLPFGAIWSTNVPSDEDFGANRMANDAKEHGDYWRPGSQSLRNQGFVVTGDYEDVKLED